MDVGCLLTGGTLQRDKVAIRGVAGNNGAEPRATTTSLEYRGMQTDFRADLEAIHNIEATPLILNVICRVTGMGFAAVARVTKERWMCLAVNDEIKFGLKPGDELEIETTICGEVHASAKPVAIDHVEQDEFYRGHPTPAMYGFQSYISMPILLKDGSFFGTLCAIDPRPAQLKNPETIGMFKLFAELIAAHLDANRQLNADLVWERKSSELREQFIAVLGHDLRNPLASIAAGTLQLQKAQLDPKSSMIVGLMQKSVGRMSTLINDVLDFARGRLGDGLIINVGDDPIEPVLCEVVEEFKATHPDSAIHARFDLDGPIRCDAARIAQLFANLLGNALSHGAAGRPVKVHAARSGNAFELAVVNEGNPISPQAMERLFFPFARGGDEADQQGLGLGLYIASEIARAHGGEITVKSTPAETKFMFRMPL